MVCILYSHTLHTPMYRVVYILYSHTLHTQMHCVVYIPYSHTLHTLFMHSINLFKQRMHRECILENAFHTIHKSLGCENRECIQHGT